MSVRIIIGDCRQVLKTLPDASVHCVVTSPPYFGLRDYGTASWEGGEAGCDHLGEPFRTSATINQNWDGGNDVKNAEKRQPFKAACGKCGARRIDSQIGLEPTPDAYVAELVAVFREVRRVLRDDGTCWINLGSSYASDASGRRTLGKSSSDLACGCGSCGVCWARLAIPLLRFKGKDSIEIPHLVALALQADGWFLRQTIIWSKPNPMPESVTDRCTKAHEYIFLLSKSARYHFDAEAIAEPSDTHDTRPGKRGSYMLGNIYGGGLDTHESSQTKRGRLNQYADGETRNKRSVWEVATAPFSEAHFATFPPALIEPCIKAGCPKGGTVLDPFAGAGTTGLVADRLGRNSVMIELNPAYAEMSHVRQVNDAGMFAEVSRDVGA